VTSHKILDSPT